MLHEIVNLNPSGIEAGVSVIFQSLGATRVVYLTLTSCKIKWHHLRLIGALYSHHLWFLPSSSPRSDTEKNFTPPCCLLQSDFLPPIHSPKDSPAVLRWACGEAFPKTIFISKLKHEMLTGWVNEPTVFLLNKILLKGWRIKPAEGLGRGQ